MAHAKNLSFSDKNNIHACIQNVQNRDNVYKTLIGCFCAFNDVMKSAKQYQRKYVSDRGL